MKTIFKANQKVYDQVNYPDYEGKVLKIHDDSILVLFDGIENYYSLDGRLNDGLPTLSTKPYEVEFKYFEQKALAPTFEEVLVNCDKRYPPNIRADVNYKEIYPTKELSEAAEALRKLLFLRDYYNNGWQPDWEVGNTTQIKFCIEVYKECLYISKYFY